MAEDWLTARARRTPEALALSWQGQWWRYGALAREVESVAAALARLGVAPGEHVAVLLPNGPPYVRLIHALARLGAVLVPLSRRLTPLELAWQVQHAGCGLLVYDEQTAAQARALANGGIVAVDASTLLGAEDDAPPPRFDPDELQAIVFTSGTTGRPKGAMLTFANHLWSATASAFRLGLQREDRWLSCLPLYHVGGLAVLLRSCLYGTAVVLQDGFDVMAYNESLDRDGVTLTSLVPTMLVRLLPTRAQWPQSLRLVLLGGAATTPDLAARCAEASVPIATTYGLTEAASQVATMMPEEARRKPGCVGKPLMFTELRIVDEAGASLAAGEIGEVVVSGPTVMRGYYGDAQATAGALVDGELHTGDAGYLDADGDLWLVQRRSDVIVTGGENVYPAEVEQALREHPDVCDACVVGVPDAEWGQRVAAMVALEADAALSEEALLAYCRQRLAGYKLPRRVALVEALPLTASGKVARAEVQEEMSGLADTSGDESVAG